MLGECDEDRDEEFEDDNISDNDDASQAGSEDSYDRLKRQEEDDIVKVN